MRLGRGASRKRLVLLLAALAVVVAACAPGNAIWVRLDPEHCEVAHTVERCGERP